jgi:mono/diheme cytochrome c family protein
VLTRLTVARGRAIALSAAALLIGGVGAGCDTQEDADLERGRQLFQTNCATCHVLAEAGGGVDVGPNLDSAFAAARETGMDQDTIEGVVQSQIENPREIHPDSANYDRTFMPADIVTGRDAEDVAAYVASVAGVPGIEPPPLGTSQELFTEQCGGCHALEAAGSPGGVGPNLDEALIGQDFGQIMESIRDPEATISGFPFPEGGVMPVFDENRIPEPNLNALIEFLMACAGDPENEDCTAAAEETTSDAPAEPAGDSTGDSTGGGG